MKPQNKLREAMKGLQATAEPAPMPMAETAQQPTWKARPTPSTRVNRRTVTVWISREAHKQLLQMGLDMERKVQDLGEEALNDLFRKYNKSAVV
ncbi:MAG: hypothetical protein JNN24_05395 [Hyphomicrobium zavarzinii]|uniref:ribbon-helix-helix domain-containing protein n=1 Tax=Hyphomicrobium zavarzinii TaxID=48292 RepID=UPI001A480049|nr:ribbon-helix-helix domain-containing protein [Hyphomicrobium zavarzinii]MBL8845186.1 hypothetical protein [Hyphomicrobium zavarzinii]